MNKFGCPATPLQNQTQKYPILRGIFGFGFIWQGWQDSNLRHTVLETVALPTELHPYGV
jgi:hypothetical protein